MGKIHSRHQILEYNTGHPFMTTVTTRADADYIYVKSSHWHEDLEMAYVLNHRNYHYIDGARLEAGPGSLVITNCESVHRILVDGDQDYPSSTPATLVLTVDRPWLDKVFPQHKELRFTNDVLEATQQEKDILLQFVAYASAPEHKFYEVLFMQGLLLQLLAMLMEHRSAAWTRSPYKSSHADAIKDILDYVAAHYNEPLTQAEMAKRFYFSPPNFARFFKEHTGVTFSEHLMAVRLGSAQKELLHSEKLVRDIAVENGFTDDRVFIRAFKRNYGVTPLQFKKVKNSQ